jgi:hypothetical protein
MASTNGDSSSVGDLVENHTCFSILCKTCLVEIVHLIAKSRSSPTNMSIVNAI